MPKPSSHLLALKAWDLLVWGLIVFPLLTGGIWVSRPGLKLELSELAVPVLLTALLGAALGSHFGRKRMGTPAWNWLSQASSVRAAHQLWRLWTAALTRKRGTLWIAALAVGTLWAWVALRRHWAFGSGSADLGIFTNAIWNLTHGHGYVSSVKDGMNLFADHQSPIFWLFAPFFALVPRAETLLVLQSLGLALTAIPLAAIGRQHLPKDHWAIAALPLLFWAYLPMRNANAFDFHPETMMLPLFLAAIAGLQSPSTKARWAGAFAFLLALGCKESAGPVAAGIGLAWVFGAGPKNQAFTRRLGWAAITAGVAVFYFDTRVVPRLLGAGYAYDSYFSQVGQGTHGIQGLLLAAFTRPLEVLSQILGIARLKFLLLTLAPLAFLPLLNPRALIAALPGYLMLFLTDGDHRVKIIYHYATEPSVGLFWALPGGVLTLERWLRMRRPGRSHDVPARAALWILFCALAAFGRSETHRARKFTPTEYHLWVREQVLPCVNPKATLAAAGALVPHLSTRRWAHHFPRALLPNGEPVDCLVDVSSVNHWPMTAEDDRAFDQFKKAHAYREVYACNGVRIEQSPHARTACAICKPECH